MAPLHNFILSRQLCRSIPSATRSSILRDLSHTRFASTSTKVKPTTPAALRYPASFLHSFRFQTTAIPRHATNPLPAIDFSAVNGIANAAKSGSRAFPETSSKSVAYWLLGSAASVFGIVIFGGLTRLTESGLSITEWKPVTGSLWPTTAEKWQSEWDKYRSSPEFQLLNSRMTLDEFKQIYFMEWFHRLWGRFIGISVLLPTIYFIARRRVAGHMAIKISAICAGIGFQGVIGWWMVKSGLKDDLFAKGSHPRVSQYRLTAHLGTAFLVYLSMVWCGLSILRENKMIADPKAGQAYISAIQNPALKVFRRSAVALALFVFATAMTGALVAGLDAGLIYNEFPYMGLGLTPPKKELLNEFYSRKEDRSDLVWRNMLENPSLVQLDHRIMATTAFSAVMAIWAYPRLARSAALRNTMPRASAKALNAVFYLAWMQVTLGISTLIYMVPTWLASSHQAGALALMTGTTILAHSLRVGPRTVGLVRRAAMQAGQASKLPNIGVRSGTGKAARSIEQRVAV